MQKTRDRQNVAAGPAQEPPAERARKAVLSDLPVYGVQNRFKVRVRVAREKLGLSVKEFAARLGVRVTTLSGWEAGVVPDGKNWQQTLTRLREAEQEVAAIAKQSGKPDLAAKNAGQERWLTRFSQYARSQAAPTSEEERKRDLDELRAMVVRRREARRAARVRRVEEKQQRLVRKQERVRLRQEREQERERERERVRERRAASLQERQKERDKKQAELRENCMTRAKARHAAHEQWWAQHEPTARHIMNLRQQGHTYQKISDDTGVKVSLILRFIRELSSREAREQRLRQLGKIDRDTSLEDFCFILPERVANFLLRSFSRSAKVGNLCAMTERDILNLPGGGPTMLDHVYAVLAPHGLSLTGGRDKSVPAAKPAS